MAKILIVDDAKTIRLTLRRILHKDNHEILEATDGNEALAMISQMPDIILLDIMMPGLTGIEVCQEIRKDLKNNTIHVVMLSALENSSDKVLALDAGADDYLTKPCDPAELQARVRKGLRAVKKSREAVFDLRTGLYNRNFFDGYLNQELSRARRYAYNVSLIIMDIDHFKRINDTFGHLVGDAVLARIGQIFHAHCRLSDLAARWGGEEFVLLLPQTDLAAAADLADRLRQKIETQPFEQVGQITASFGVSDLQSAGDLLFKKADEAIYLAKQQGRNRVFTCNDLTESTADQNH